MPQVKEDNFLDKRFGRLLVISYSHSESRKGYSRAYWNCLCDCGNEVQVRSDHLTREKTKSCGCLRKELRGHRTPEGQTSFVKLYSNYKHDAKKRGLKFDLTKSDFYNLTQKDCCYCGSPPSSYYKMKDANGGILYNGIDRINSSIGYTIDNCVSCCGFCNRAKIDLDVKEFLLWIERLKSHHIMMEEVYFANR